jgi:T5SS/PEP-CTERM-associated repeat protein
MDISWTRLGLAGTLLSGILLAPAGDAFGATMMNRWTNSADGLWQTASNWSSNTPPTSSFGLILITNAVTKTVTIDSATPSANLSIQKLTISAPADSTNTLQLVDLTLNQPLQLSSTLTVDRLGVLNIANSALNINGLSGGILNVSAGSLRLDSGLVDCSTTTSAKIGSSSSGPGLVTINGGTMLVYQMQIGSVSGGQGMLNLSNGVLNAASLITLGDTFNSTGMVSVAGGQLIATNGLTRVGNLGAGQVTISGGSANFAMLSLGDNFNSSGTVSVTGGQLILTPRTTNDWLRVGNHGNGELDISGGTNLILSEFHLADDLVSTGIVSVTGGQLVSTNEMTAIGRYGVGLMTVSNASVQLTNSSVGRHDGAIGTLIVQTNGIVAQVGDLSIARFSNSVGHVLVSGGLLSLPNDNVWVGREGTGDLTVSNGMVQARAMFVGMSDDGTNVPVGTVVLAGGATLLSSNLVIGTGQLSTGQVVVAGGSLSITNPGGTACLNIPNGSLALNAGTLTADQIFLTNTAGQFAFNSGTLQAMALMVSNGLPFVVGDGSSPATLQLLGGTYTFADGLVISSNATVTGCGTIFGQLANYGTIATNCGPMVVIKSIGKAGPLVTLSFTSLSGSNHIVEYKDALNATNWTAILPGMVGDGSVMTNWDTNATGQGRFYRIRVR